MPKSSNLSQKLLYRELDGNRGMSSASELYGSRRWIDDLDIIGELRGHQGCINALSWSRDGSLLASGGDDKQVNIYKSYAGFSLNTQIHTGHTQNIFSVKFMPYSGDRTIVTAAGDMQVRVFDIEYAPTTYSSLSTSMLRAQPPPVAAATPRRHRGSNTWYQDPTPGKIHSTASRVYTSHTDRAKRIVTESSPHLFLTCSEDGTVRQFDLRQPSEFYTRPGASVAASHMGLYFDEEDERNPPLISYRQHGIDLNTISCSTSQPHYIALGGSHLFCFLHDRRMLGRDRLQETGQKARVSTSSDSEEHDGLSAATKCVRRFAPKLSKNWDRHMQNSHVTSCKISDANPNEMVVSWSGDGVYLFDINHTPEPWDPEEERKNMSKAKREHNAKARMRKHRRSRSPSAASSAEEVVPGQSMRKISSLVVELRRELFGLRSSNLLGDDVHDLAEERQKSYNAALALAHAALKRMYRVTEKLEVRDLEVLGLLHISHNDESLHLEQTRRSTLARNRRNTRAFVMAAGCVARALGGFVESIGLGEGAFEGIATGTNEFLSFRYHFLSAVLTFIESGVDGLSAMADVHYFDVYNPEDSEGDSELAPSHQEKLDAFLRDLGKGAQATEVRDVDTNEEVFDTEFSMVTAFKQAVALHSESTDGSFNNTARKFWGERVARAVLMKEAEGINFEFVERAFEDDTTDGAGDEEGIEPGRPLFGENGDGEGDDVETPLVDDDDEYAEDDDVDADDVGEDEENDDEDSGDEGDFWFRQRRTRRGPVEPDAPIWKHQKVYRGHCNVRTVKDVNFFGRNDEYVVSGSDCGHLFIWDKKTTELVQLLKGDDETTNVAVGHPYEPLLAVSGIDYTVKLFSPDQELQREFGKMTEADAGHESTGQEEYSGYGSRRKLSERDHVTRQNAVASETGVTNAVITFLPLQREMLQDLIERLRSEEEGGAAIIESGECNMM